MEGTLRVIRPSDYVSEKASGAMVRQAAVSRGTVGARKIWVGYVELGPGLQSAVHHHGESESVIYVISGSARFYAGESLDLSQEASAGDMVWVPPYAVHVEMNTSQREPVRMVVARSSQETLVFNLPAPEGFRPEAEEHGR